MPVETQTICPDAPAALAEWARAQGYSRISLVCDDRTWAVLGAAVRKRLVADSANVQVIRLAGPEVVADEARIVEILLAVAAPDDRLYVAIGAGTLCDLTRFASHRSGRPFVSLPTAPSVDAFTSMNAPLVIRGLKLTIDAQQPLAVFADIDVLCAAPPQMIAAGAGDVLGKFTALADWRLAALLWDEEIDEDIVADMDGAVRAVAGAAEGIGRREPEAIAKLMRALLDSGEAMARWRNSRPASGSEHHLSHYWETMRLLRGQPALLHGAKVGVGSVLMARAYERLRAISRAQAAAMLAATPEPDTEAERETIRSGYGPIADEVMSAQGDLLPLAPGRWARLQREILENWDAIQGIAAEVPAPEKVAGMLRAAGAPVKPAELGISSADVDDALRYGHYIRDRFTIRRLERALGLP
ncbi:MAG: sn-glycerol-1-phosphate dehydrogenase [Anaerolineae bacterium]